MNLLEVKKELEESQLNHLSNLSNGKSVLTELKDNTVFFYCERCHSYHFFNKIDMNEFDINRVYSYDPYTVTCPSCGVVKKITQTTVYYYNYAVISSLIAHDNFIISGISDTQDFPLIDCCEIDASEYNMTSYRAFVESKKGQRYSRNNEFIGDYVSVIETLKSTEKKFSMEEYTKFFNSFFNKYTLVEHSNAGVFLYLLIRENPNILKVVNGSNKETAKKLLGFIVNAVKSFENGEKKPETMVKQLIKKKGFTEEEPFTLPTKVLLDCKTLEMADTWRRYFVRNKITDEEDMKLHINIIGMGDSKYVNHIKKCHNAGADLQKIMKIVYLRSLFAGYDKVSVAKDLSAATSHLKKVGASLDLLDNAYVSVSNINNVNAREFFANLGLNNILSYLSLYDEGKKEEECITVFAEDKWGFDHYYPLFKSAINQIENCTADEVLFLDNGDMAVLVKEVKNFFLYCIRMNVEVSHLAQYMYEGEVFLYKSQSSNKAYIIDHNGQILIERECE